MTNDKLKPCRDAAKIAVGDEGVFTPDQIACLHDMIDEIDAWNTRPTDDALVEALERISNRYLVDLNCRHSEIVQHRMIVQSGISAGNVSATELKLKEDQIKARIKLVEYEKQRALDNASTFCPHCSGSGERKPTMTDNTQQHDFAEMQKEFEQGVLDIVSRAIGIYTAIQKQGLLQAVQDVIDGKAEIVPSEPTNDMVGKGMDVGDWAIDGSWRYGYPEDMYKAMLAASPYKRSE